MIGVYEITELMKCFPQSFMNCNGEVILHEKSNTYIPLKNCVDKFDIAMNLIEYVSRSACKTAPYRRNDFNKAFNNSMLDSMNKYLGTDFTNTDMMKIYEVLGNGINHKKTNEFISNNYDLKLLDN